MKTLPITAIQEMNFKDKKEYIESLTREQLLDLLERYEEVTQALKPFMPREK